MRSESLSVTNGLGLEEAPAQHFGHVFFLNWLNAFLTLSTEDRGQLACKLLAQWVAPGRVGRKQRGHYRTTVYLGSGLGQILEKIQHLPTPGSVETDFLADVHQYLVNQDKCREVLSVREGKQFGQQVLCRSAFALSVFSFRIQQPQSFGAGNLIPHYAPGMFQPSSLSVRAASLHALFGVELIESENGDTGVRRLDIYVPKELGDS